ncbi:MAG TPA: outer membrane protein assembly factor BamE [Nitrospiraceae bacterium]|nr:outer membrane protein assembly factor BamE [Nitrospiraceae bacterium]
MLDQATVSQIKIGESTKEDVRRLLGSPNHTSITQMPSQQIEVWAYGYAKHETNPLIYVPVVNLFVLAFGGLGEHESGSVAVSFDKDGIVGSMSKYKSDITMGGLATPTTIQGQSNTQSGTSTDPVRFQSQPNINTSVP